MIDQTFLFPFCWGARSLPLSHLWVCWAGYGYFWFMFDNLWIGIFSVEFPLIPDSWSSQPPNSSDISEYIDYIHPKLHSCEFETTPNHGGILVGQSNRYCKGKKIAAKKTELDCEHEPLTWIVNMDPWRRTCPFLLKSSLLRFHASIFWKYLEVAVGKLLTKAQLKEGFSATRKRDAFDIVVFFSISLQNANATKHQITEQNRGQSY